MIDLDTVPGGHEAFATLIASAVFGILKFNSWQGESAHRGTQQDLVDLSNKVGTMELRAADFITRQQQDAFRLELKTDLTIMKTEIFKHIDDAVRRNP